MQRRRLRGEAVLARQRALLKLPVSHGASAMPPSLKYEQRGHVVTRPCLSTSMDNPLTRNTGVEEIPPARKNHRDLCVRAVILTCEGPAFAGAAHPQGRRASGEGRHAYPRGSPPAHGACRCAVQLQGPVIAAVNDPAVGAGLVWPA